jgi:carboxylate-amine ligase
VRALARTCYEQALRDEPFVTARPELLRAAQWRAARYGLDGELMDISTLTSIPARDIVEKFLAFVRPSLEDSGEWDEISSIVYETMQRGTGATRQREAYKQAGRLEDVVDLIVNETEKGTVSM